MDCSPPGASVHGDSPGQNTGVGGHFLLQGFIPTQGSNPGPSVLCRLVLWLWGESRRAPASSLCSFVALSPPAEPISTSVLHFSLKHHLSIPFQVHHVLPETRCFWIKGGGFFFFFWYYVTFGFFKSVYSTILWKTSERESCSVVSDSLQPQGLYIEFSRHEYWSE